jgi:hypothetical protein
LLKSTLSASAATGKTRATKKIRAIRFMIKSSFNALSVAD